MLLLLVHSLIKFCEMCTERETKPQIGLCEISCEINCLPRDNITGIDLAIAQIGHAGTKMFVRHLGDIEFVLLRNAPQATI